MMKSFSVTKVVSKNFAVDILTQFQNLIGKNLTPYEKMVHKATQQCEEEMNKQSIVPEWYRYEITQLTNGAVAVMIYGDKK